MKRIKTLVIILLVLSLFSCKSTDFKRIHKEVVEVEAPPETVDSTTAIEEEAVVSASSEFVEDETLMPLYENGSVVQREDEGTEVTAGETKSESGKTESVISSVPAAEGAVQKEEKEAFPYMKIILPSAALILILIIVLISVRASRGRTHKSGKIKEGGEEFSYSFDDGEYEVYMGTLDYDDCGEDEGEEDNDVDDIPTSRSAAEIISILKGT